MIVEKVEIVKAGEIWKYAFGACLIHKDEFYVYIDKMEDHDLVFMKDGKSYCLSDFVESEEEELSVAILETESSLKELVKGLVDYILILTEDSVNDDTIEFLTKRLSVASFLLEKIKGKNDE